MATPNVAFIRPELSRLLPLYQTIRDCLAGEPTVKGAKDKYLPRPNASDTSAENKLRYEQYVARAVFYNVTRRTLTGLVGQVFMREPIVKVPASLEGVMKDATGSGIDLEQQSKKSLALTLAYSRSGIHVDYPTVQAPDKPEGQTAISKAEIESNDLNPTITSYSPLEIINWRVTRRGSKEILSLVVLAEKYAFEDDGFEMKNSLQFKVLFLNDAGDYQQQVWRESNTPTTWDGYEPVSKFKNKLFAMVAEKTVTPTDFAGNTWKEIPFTFIGSENNDSMPDNPNFYDLASLNIAHYRNSADYEEACFIVGQPTIVVSGVTEEWVKDVLKGVIAFGSRGGIPLPVGGDAKLVQAEANLMIKESMDTKEAQMVALGAKLVELKAVQRTAFEAKVDATSAASTLQSTAVNVSKAYTLALGWCARFVGDETGDIEFSLNRDYDISNMTPEERKQAVAEWQAGAITFEEMRVSLRKSGIATEDDATAKETIATDQVAALKLEQPFNTPTGQLP